MLTGYAQGRFDVIHHGHILMLQSARRYLGPGGRLIVGVATDAFCREWKGKPPVLTWHERAQVIRHLEMVDLVIPYAGYPDAVHQRIGFDVFFCTDELYEQEREYYRLRPWKTVFLPRTPDISSTAIKERLA